MMDINFAGFQVIFQLNLKLRYAVEISDKKILISEKFKLSSFTGKKNQAFWTWIDDFRSCFSTPAYVDFKEIVSLKSLTTYFW